MSGWRAGMDFMADKAMKTVNIKAKFDGKTFVTPKGEALPALKKGATVEIRVIATSLADQEAVRRLTATDQVEVLPAGTLLYAVVRGLPDAASRDLPPTRQELDDRDYLRWCLHERIRDRFAGDTAPFKPEGAVEVILQEPLFMTLRGDKRPNLQPCRCEIPYFRHSGEKPEDPSATSLNHALTRISERFETTRISHSGNAFLRYFEDRDGRLQRLDTISDWPREDHPTRQAADHALFLAVIENKLVSVDPQFPEGLLDLHLGDLLMAAGRRCGQDAKWGPLFVQAADIHATKVLQAFPSLQAHLGRHYLRAAGSPVRAAYERLVTLCACRR